MEFPDILFQAGYEVKDRMCLACGKDTATSVLCTTSKEIVPLCDRCGSDWNFHGYYILKRLKPTKLLGNILKYKLSHPFKPSFVTIYRDLKSYNEWGKNMKKFSKHL